MRGVARLGFGLVLLLICRWTSAAPMLQQTDRDHQDLSTNILRIPPSRGGETSTGPSWKPLGYLASKMVGAFIKAVSLVYQWLPSLPSFLKPRQPTIRFVKNPNARDGRGFSVEDFQ